LAQLETTVTALGIEIGAAALRETFTADKPAIRDEDTFKARLKSEQSRLHALHIERTRLVLAVLQTTSELTTILTKGQDLQQSTCESILDQLAWLVFSGFAESTPLSHLQEVPRYLEACRMRIQRCKINPAGDSRKEAELQPVWQQYTDFIESNKLLRADKKLLNHYRWMVEEFRVSLFAQELRTPYPVSSKRLNTLWSELTTHL